MHWSAQYIGRKPDEVGDCWGLVRLVYQEQFNIELPELPGITIASAFERRSEIQTQIEENWIPIVSPEDGCGVAMSQTKAVHHVGIWIAEDGGRVLHCHGSQNVIADTLRGLKWRGYNVVKFYRSKSWPM